MDAKGEARILDRHASSREMPGKSECPSSWSDERILHECIGYCNRSSTRMVASKFIGYVTTTKMIDGIEMKIVYDTVNNRIVMTYPTNVPRNP